jgi:ADP-ribose pyrophosphatase YjhB (NUDIX family)
MRLRLYHLAYRLAWRLLWLTAPLHHGRGAGVKAILSHRDRVLLVMHTYGPRRWELPGGGLHRREDPIEGIRREIREELSVELPSPRLVAYGCGSGRQRKRVISVFAAEIDAGDVKPDHKEIERAEWYHLDNLPPRLGWQVTAGLKAWARGDAGAPVQLPARSAA